MMKTIKRVSGVALFLMSTNALADVSIYGQETVKQEKQDYAVGLFAYGQSLLDEDAIDTITGYGISGMTTLMPLGNSGVLIKGSYSIFDVSAEDTLEGTAYDVSLVWGHGFREKGVMWYIGPGYFNEDWDTPYLVDDGSGSYIQQTESQSVSSWLVTSGIGYNWNNIGTELWVTYKNGSEYKPPLDNVDGAITVGLSVSYRF